MTAEVEVEIWAVEGKARVAAIVGIVEHPLAQRPYHGQAGCALGYEQGFLCPLEPVGDVTARRVDVRAQTTAQITRQCAQSRQDLETTEEAAQVIVGRAQEVLTDVLHEVQVIPSSGLPAVSRVTPYLESRSRDAGVALLPAGRHSG